VSADGIVVRPALDADLDAVVAIHLSSFPGFFLTQLGAGFLGQMYAGFLADRGSIFQVAVVDGQIVGFVTGSADPGGQDWRVALRRAPRLLLHALPAIAAHPVRIPLRLAEKLLGRDRSPERPDGALLRSVAVAPAHRGTPVAAALVVAFERCAREAGARQVFLTTDAEGNERVNRFYLRSGYAVHARFVQHGTRPMNLYLKALSADAASPGRGAAP
jgi:GNAT superfamily N-acetyltransferase